MANEECEEDEAQRLINEGTFRLFCTRRSIIRLTLCRVQNMEEEFTLPL